MKTRRQPTARRHRKRRGAFMDKACHGAGTGASGGSTEGCRDLEREYWDFVASLAGRPVVHGQGLPGKARPEKRRMEPAERARGEHEPTMYHG